MDELVTHKLWLLEYNQSTLNIFMLHRRRKTKYRGRREEERLRISRSGGLRCSDGSGLTVRTRTRMLDSQKLHRSHQSPLACIKTADNVETPRIFYTYPILRRLSYTM
ncbi:hypothetical protein CBL_11523 [Carabus blaptoides fortunei]